MNEDIKIAEIFIPSIQGEGPNIGAKCMFVRVLGCDFRCSFCDSKFTWKLPSNVLSYTPDELAEIISDKCKDKRCKRVILTGGNPCLYNFDRVIRQSDHDIAFDIETQGSIIPDWLGLLDTVVFSPKPPSSGMKDTYDNIVDYIKTKSPEGQQVAIKIPVFTDEDIDFARHYARFLNSWTDAHDNELKLYLSVGNSDVETKESIRDRVLADYESLINKINDNFEDFTNVFILPQLHTLVWGNKQGV